MASEEPLETLFESCVLEVFTPDASISFPEDGVVGDDWINSVKQPHAERKQAFFDERLNLLLVMHIKHPSLNNLHDPHNPPRSLVGLLSHVQVSLDAMYISHAPIRDVSDTASLVPPRTLSMPSDRTQPLHPSIFPPITPNPIPSTKESDRKYVQSEGTLLFSSIWGTKRTAGESKEKFTLLFSEAQRSWVAVYELSLIVSYLRLPYSEPLLCLTASATLRDKALFHSQSAHPFITYLAKASLTSHLDAEATVGGEDADEDEETEDTGFEEVNLLDGLTIAGSGLSLDAEPLHLPSTRLGNTTRQRFFSLPPVSAATGTPPATSKQTPTHILRKSYRKILQTVSGFRVRMRTVFIPHVLLPKSSTFENRSGATDRDDFQSENQELEAGNNEHTVVLCVEVENSGESGPAIGFSLEHLDVKIGGEGATTRLIGWGEGAFSPQTEKHLFPLRIRSMEQYNLLYVVSFWSTPNGHENLLFTSQGIHDDSELQRSVTITVYGRPYVASEANDETDILSYPTQTFSSRWNCILDLSSRSHEEPAGFHEPSAGGRSALPEPPSPFPGRTAFSSLSSSPTPTKPASQAVMGKRHTLPGSITAMRAINPSSNYRLSLPSREQPGSTAPVAPTPGSTPPSVALQAFNRSSSLPSVGGSGFDANTSPSQVPAQPFVTPPTPAYPAFSPGVPTNLPHIQSLGSQQGYPGLSVEIRRERGTGMTSGTPQTPLPTVLNARFGDQQELLPTPSGEPIVVSVGLLPSESDNSYPLGQRKIYPSDQFTLDIFVFNQSSWTRKLEISCPNTDRRQRKAEQNTGTLRSNGKDTLEKLKASIVPPGILPLQNRVRVGPLEPSTCQSVRMDFLALSPGVHSVSLLAITDIETGYAVNLRSVLDIVVHERRVEEKKVA